MAPLIVKFASPWENQMKMELQMAIILLERLLQRPTDLSTSEY